MLSRFHARAFAAALTAGLAVAAMPAHAQTGELRVKQVRYDDLDLSSAKDRARLDARLARAATWVCGSSDVRDSRMAEAAASCQRTAFDQAKQRLAVKAGGSRIASVADR